MSRLTTPRLILGVAEWLVLPPRRRLINATWQRVLASSLSGIVGLIIVMGMACGPAGGGQNEDVAAKPKPTGISTRAPTATVKPSSRTPTLATANVTRVIDGDTIEVSIEGKTLNLRYIGVDAPETSDPSRPSECYGQEATAANEGLVGGKTVGLEKDVSETDGFGRLLRYVWIDDKLVNEELLLQGSVVSSTFPPDVKHQSRLLAAERQARAANRGLWGRCGGADTPSQATPAPATPTSPAQPPAQATPAPATPTSPAQPPAAPLQPTPTPRPEYCLFCLP